MIDTSICNVLEFPLGFSPVSRSLGGARGMCVGLPEVFCRLAGSTCESGLRSAVQAAWTGALCGRKPVVDWLPKASFDRLSLDPLEMIVLGGAAG